jgi:hypothetical protein
METISLKALAHKVLQRNSKGNSVETPLMINGNSEGNSHGTAYKVYSEILEDYLWIVETDKDLHTLRDRGIQDAVYTLDECQKMKGVDKEHLRVIHEVKKVFKNSRIEEHKNSETL